MGSQVSGERATRARLACGPLLIVVAVAFATIAALGLYWPGARGPARDVAQTWNSANEAAAPTRSSTLTFLDPPRPVPLIHFVDGEGRAVVLSDFRGRVILLNVWATWCLPCRKEMPALDRLQATLGGPDFQVVPLSIDRQGTSVVKPFYHELGLKALGIYVDQTGDATQALKTVGVPTSVLIDRSGREIARHMGGADWDSPEMINTIRQRLGSSTQ